MAVRTASVRRRRPTFTGEVAGVGTSGVASQPLSDWRGMAIGVSSGSQVQAGRALWPCSVLAASIRIA